MGEPLRTTPGKRMGCSQLLLHGPCGPGPTPPRTTRIQSCRGASSLPRSPIRLPHKTGYPKGRDKPMNGAAVIAEILRREGTEFLSCYPRNHLIEPGAALDIRPILCRQERVGVGLADGYTRIKRGKRNGVFAAQAGPGIENAFPGIAQAYSENVPLLVIPAGLPLARQYVRPTFRAADVYRPVTKWSALAHTVEELPELMRRAYHAMRSGKGGPVLIEIPTEVWEADYRGELDYSPLPVQRSAPDPDAVKAAVKMLLAAKSPLLWAGQGVLYAEASDRLAALAELMPAPGVTTNPGKSAIPRNHPPALRASTRPRPQAYTPLNAPVQQVIYIVSLPPWPPPP